MPTEEQIFPQPPVLKSLPVNDQAFYRVGREIVGPLTETEKRNKHIAVAMDYLTKWAEVRVIPDEISSTLTRSFEENTIARHCCPR